MNEKPLKLTSPFVAIAKVFYSPGLYQEVLQHWRKRALLFLLVLLVIFWLPFVVRFMMNLNHLIDNMSANVIKQFPALHIKAGIATSEKKGTHFIFYPKTSVPLIVINTEGSYKHFKQSVALAFLGKDEILVKENEGSVFKFYYPKNVDITLTGEELVKMFNQHKISAAVFFFFLLYVIGLVIIYILYLIYALLLSLLISSIFSGVDRVVSFRESLRLSIIAGAPAFILFSLLYLLWLLSYGVAIVLLLILLFYALFVTAYCYQLLPKK